MQQAPHTNNNNIQSIKDRYYLPSNVIYLLQISANQFLLSLHSSLVQCGHRVRNFGLTGLFDLRCVATMSVRASINSGWSLGAAALRIISIPS